MYINQIPYIPGHFWTFPGHLDVARHLWTLTEIPGHLSGLLTHSKNVTTSIHCRKKHLPRVWGPCRPPWLRHWSFHAHHLFVVWHAMTKGDVIEIAFVLVCLLSRCCVAHAGRLLQHGWIGQDIVCFCGCQEALSR